MNLHEKTLAIENKIIDFLTMICWWTEVRFDISNLGWYIRSSIMNTIFYVALLGMWCLMSFTDHRYVWFSVASLLEFFVVIYFISLVRCPERKIFMAIIFYPQGFPNPCRFLKYKDRRISVFTVIVLWLMIDKSSETDFEFIVSMLLVLTQVVDVFERFFLSCDSMPPGEKARRRAAREMALATPVPV